MKKIKGELTTNKLNEIFKVEKSNELLKPFDLFETHKGQTFIKIKPKLIVMLEEFFVPYKISMKAKALGYNELCMRWWQRIDFNNKISVTLEDNYCKNTEEWIIKTKSCAAPLYQQMTQWARVEYQFRISEIQVVGICYWEITSKLIKTERHFDTFDEAVDKCLDLIKVKQDKTKRYNNKYKPL